MKKYILIFFSSALLTTSFAQSWSLTGNSNTNPPTNFLGTKDSKALVFKTNNTERMRINPTGNGNIGIGLTNPLQRLDVNGNINLGKGFSLFMENRRVLRVDSADANTFLGNGAGTANTSVYNTATGYYALSSNTSGDHNTAFGSLSLFSNSNGYYNTATGTMALYSNTTGYNNVANGSYAIFSSRNGHDNTAIGYGALYTNTDGINNVAAGRGSLGANTEGHSNTAIGADAMYSNTTAIFNTAVGAAALGKNTTGSYNTAIGDYALYETTGSFGNTAVGDVAGSVHNHGYYNTFLGSETNATIEGIYNSTAIGNGTIVSAPSQVRIGNSYVNSIGGYTNWSNISDGRVKKNMKENVPGLVFINKLRPVTYNLDLDAADKIIQRPLMDKDDSVARGKLPARQRSQTEISARNAKQQIVYTGFVAQEVEKAAKELNYDFSGVDAAKSDKDLYALRYSDFVVPLVKAVQELSKMNNEKDHVIDDLKTRIEKLETMMNVQSSTSIDQQQSIKISSASLEQNIPNPFNSATKINYTLPQQFTSAKIIITDKSGKTLKDIKLPGQGISGTGKGSVNINASTLSAGAYNYSLYINGILINTKQMMLIK